MKPQLLKITHQPVTSFSVRQDIPNINSRWHYHPEIELICFHKGGGTQFIGDHIKKFAAGDVVMLGSNLPHYWMFDEYLVDTEKHLPYSTVIHFEENFIGERFLHLPESRELKILLEKAQQGILVSGKEAEHVITLMGKVKQSSGFKRIISLMECLSALAEVEHLTLLSSIGFRYHEYDSENERLNAIYNFTLKNFMKKIELKEVAAITGLIPNSFCRYFKTRTGKTYNQFLLEIRIGYACKLLLDNTQSIKQVCFESGFNNFSCFHKNFKSITGYTPQGYQHTYLKQKHPAGRTPNLYPSGSHSLSV